MFKMQKRLISLVIAVSLLLVLPSLCFGLGPGKTGGGGLPGAGCACMCSEGQKCVWQYVTPPYLGTIYGNLNTNCGTQIQITTDGEVKQVGQSECSFNIPDTNTEPYLCQNYPPPENPGDIRGLCLTGLDSYSSDPVNCIKTNAFEVVGAGNLSYSIPDISFKADVVVMGLKWVGCR